jgi:maltose O-acetyltransferase
MRSIFDPFYYRTVFTWRRVVLLVWRLRGAQLGKGARINGKVKCEGTFRNLEIGRDVSLNYGVFLNLRDRVTIGDNVHISAYAQIHSGYLVVEEIPRYHQSAPIVVEDGAWIASGAIIGAGVTVGRNAVVAAGSVVVESVPAGTLVGGVPAKVIRQLNIRKASPA